MALPTSMTSGSLVLRRAGIRVAAFPSDPTFWTEVQCSSSTAYATSRTRFQKFAPTAANFVTATFETPYSTLKYFARARHFKVGYSTGPWSNLGSDVPGYLVGGMPDVHKIATRMSSLHNPQGSILPNPSGASGMLTYSSGGGTNGHMWLTWKSIANVTMYRPDQTSLVINLTTVGVSGYDVPGTASLSAVAGGALGARTYFVYVAYVKDRIVYPLTGGEASLAVGANNLLRVAAPTTNTNYDGWCVWVGTASNTEVLQGTLGASTTALQPFGSPWTEPVGGAATSSTTNTPFNAVQQSGLTLVDLAASGTFFIYPFVDPNFIAVASTGTVGIRLAPITGAFITAANAAAAAVANGDGHYCLSLNGVSGATPAAGNSGSGSGGGGKYL